MKLSSKKSITLMKLKAAPPKPSKFAQIYITIGWWYQFHPISSKWSFIHPFDVALVKNKLFVTTICAGRNQKDTRFWWQKIIHCHIWRLGCRISIHSVPLWATSSNLQKHIRARNEKDTVIRSQKSHCWVYELY